VLFFDFVLYGSMGWFIRDSMIPICNLPAPGRKLRQIELRPAPQKKALEQTRAGAETFFLERYYKTIITVFHDFVKMKKV